MSEQDKIINTRLNLILVPLVVLALIVGFLWFRSATNNPRRKAMDQTIASQKTELAIMKGKQEAITPKSVNEQIKSDNINLSNELATAEQNITEAFTDVYSQTKNQSDYDELKGKIKPLIGSELSSELLDLDKPIINQSGESTLKYDNLDSIKISFGKYDTNTKVVEGLVIADYSSPKVETTTAGQKDKTYTTNKGQDLFKIEISAKDGSIHYLEHSNQIKEGVSND